MTKAVQPNAGTIAADLVRRISDGDREAESRLVELHSRGLSYLLLHLTNDRSLSEDLHQETLRIVLEKIRRGELREPEKLAGFIRSTARNLSIAEFRKAARRPALEDVEAIGGPAEPADPAPSQLSRVLQEEDRRCVRHVLGELRSDRDRELLYRFHIAEEPKAEICDALGLSSRQFNLALHRARQRFKQLVEKSAPQLRAASPP